MPSLSRHGEIGQVLVEVEEGRAGEVAGGVELPPALGRAQLPATVDELVAHPGIVSARTSGYNAHTCVGGFSS